MIYKLYGAISNADGIASLDVQNKGVIESINFVVVPGFTANGDQLEVEVSFMSSNTFQTNDTRGSIGQIGTKFVLFTNGLTQSGLSQYFGEMNVKVNPGERIYLHTKISGTVTGSASVYLYVNDGINDIPPRRRR